MKAETIKKKIAKELPEAVYLEVEDCGSYQIVWYDISNTTVSSKTMTWARVPYWQIYGKYLAVHTTF